MKNSEHDIRSYLGLPYTIRLRPDTEGDFVAHIEELPGCIAHGGTAEEALAMLREHQRLWIEDCIESGQRVPLPVSDPEMPSGRWVQRVPRTLHKRLSELAKQEEVSLNQLVTSMLSECVGYRSRTASESRFHPLSTKGQVEKRSRPHA